MHVLAEFDLRVYWEGVKWRVPFTPFTQWSGFWPLGGKVNSECPFSSRLQSFCEGRFRLSWGSHRSALPCKNIAWCEFFFSLWKKTCDNAIHFTLQLNFKMEWCGPYNALPKLWNGQTTESVRVLLCTQKRASLLFQVRSLPGNDAVGRVRSAGHALVQDRDLSAPFKTFFLGLHDDRRTRAPKLALLAMSNSPVHAEWDFRKSLMLARWAGIAGNLQNLQRQITCSNFFFFETFSTIIEILIFGMAWLKQTQRVFHLHKLSTWKRRQWSMKFPSSASCPPPFPCPGPWMASRNLFWFRFTDVLRQALQEFIKFTSNFTAERFLLCPYDNQPD